MAARHDAARTNPGAARDTASPRSWVPPQVRRLATSAAELGAGAGTDTDETPS